MFNLTAEYRYYRQRAQRPAATAPPSAAPGPCNNAMLGPSLPSLHRMLRDRIGVHFSLPMFDGHPTPLQCCARCTIALGSIQACCIFNSCRCWDCPPALAPRLMPASDCGARAIHVIVLHQVAERLPVLSSSLRTLTNTS